MTGDSTHHARCATGNCFTCQYWEERIQWAENGGMMPASGRQPAGVLVRVDGQHYVAFPLDTDTDAHGLGHSGEVFTFQFTDGRQCTSNNVWSQGLIPAQFRDRLPDNAVIVPQAPPKTAIPFGEFEGLL